MNENINNVADELHQLTKETANASFSIGANDEEWNIYFLSRKHKIANKDLPSLLKDAQKFILENRTRREVKETETKRKGTIKPYTL